MLYVSDEIMADLLSGIWEAAVSISVIFMPVIGLVFGFFVGVHLLRRFVS